MSARNNNQSALFRVLATVTISIAMFAVSGVTYAGTSGLQVAAGEGGGSYGGTTGTESRPGQTTERSTNGSTNGNAADDSMITAKVKSALISDDQVKAFDISVKTHKGEVALTGMVENQEQINRAVQLASDVDGVRSVSNRLTVKK